MIQIVRLSDFRSAFANMGRIDQFSYEGLELIFHYIEEYEQETKEPQTLDVIGICCDWEESAPAEILDQYDTDINTEDMTAEEIAAAVFEWLNDETIVAGTTSAGDFVYVQF